jgi:tripartite-type tricarboxylate transporter receptor subunit TctC
MNLPDRYRKSSATVALLAALFSTTATANVVVSEVRVVDSKGRGIKSRIIELTRERKELDVDDTDGNGRLTKRFTCQQWHKLFAKPIAGPYTQSEFTNCQSKMTLTVRNLNFFPETTVRVLAPFSAGSTPDTLTRLLAARLAEALGQKVLVDNKPEQGGLLAAGAVAEAAPDGYTFFLGTSLNLTIYPVMLTKVPYDAPKDFAPVTMVASVPNVLVSSARLRADTLSEVIEDAKKEPGKWKFSSPGYGTLGHLAGEQLNMLSGIKLVHVPYKGSAQVLQSLLSGDTQITFSTLPLVLPAIKSGELRALAVTSEKRVAVLPNVPTVAEAGIRDYGANNWTGLVAPAGTPSAVIQRVQAELMKILRTEEIQAKFLSEGAIAIGSTPEELAAAINSDLARWHRVVRAASIKKLN